MRKEKVERSFADSKERQGLRCFRVRGKGKAQALMTDACRNMKDCPSSIKFELSFSILKNPQGAVPFPPLPSVGFTRKLGRSSAKKGRGFGSWR
ncbi:hypothetical protein GLV97_10535 [Halobacillus litoralis]|nr:hypothetical protein [Halobacillus litoralis]